MKIYISADLEGINGICHGSQTQPGEAGYERAIGLMHKEIQALVDGLHSAGATDIYIADAHWDARNIRPELLPAGINLISGWQRPYSMVSGISGQIGTKTFVEGGFDGLFLLGYHAKAGVACGVLSHTYRAKVFLEVKLNGVSVGEIGLNAALAGYYGVPVGFISGDDTTCNEARNLIGSLTTVVTKKAISRYSALMLPEQEVLSSIKQGAIEAISKRDYWNIFLPTKPSTLHLTMTDPAMADACELLPEIKRLDDRTVEISHSEYAVLFRLFLAAGVLGASRLEKDF